MCLPVAVLLIGVRVMPFVDDQDGHKTRLFAVKCIDVWKANSDGRS